jgi:hypothetical protein
MVLGGTAAAAATQVHVQAPGLPEGTPYAHYGTPEAVELSALTMGAYERRVVQTRGALSALETTREYFELSEGGQVVLMPTRELGDSLRSVDGRRVEVIGFVRPLVEQQGKCRISPTQTAPQSYCDNPDLPPTPDLVGTRTHWPRTSITAWSVSDITPLERGHRGPERSPLMDLLAAATPSEKPIRVVGRFCGAGLCGAVEGRPDPSAWVLQDEEASVWVIGKEPKGKGWRLDPAYKGDTTRWLEVTGRLQPCGPARCLRAQSIVLVPRPDASASP